MLPVQIFQDSGIPRFVRNSQMKGGSRAVGHSGSVDAEGLLLQFVHGFAHGGEVVEYILRPDADAHYGAGVSGTVVYGLRQEQ